VSAPPTLAVIATAFNEAAVLPVTVPALRAAQAELSRQGTSAIVVVVDNASTDATAKVAQQLGLVVVHEPRRGVGRARNTGARAVDAPYLLFVDADAIVPVQTFAAVVGLMMGGDVAGGTIEPEYRPRDRWARVLCVCWEWYRVRAGGAQGVALFCTREAFEAIGGFDEGIYMGEDYDFFKRLTAHGRVRGRRVLRVDTFRVLASSRRYDAWPWWRMLLWQNPVTVRLLPRSRRMWRHWTDTPVR
jgi:glycosyltransferase involved in cell wall biosynthesis